MSIVGAEVDVKADVKLFPLGITLKELQVTNPDVPETNSFECRHIAFNVDSLNLLRRKVIINEMAVEGMRFDTKRTAAGEGQQEGKGTAEEGRGRAGQPVRTARAGAGHQDDPEEREPRVRQTDRDNESRSSKRKKLTGRSASTRCRTRQSSMPTGNGSRRSRQLPKGDVFGMAGQAGRGARVAEGHRAGPPAGQTARERLHDGPLVHQGNPGSGRTGAF